MARRPILRLISASATMADGTAHYAERVGDTPQLVRHAAWTVIVDTLISGTKTVHI